MSLYGITRTQWVNSLCPCDVTLIFIGSSNAWFLWSNYQEVKNEGIDWTPSLKCTHQFWPWAWPWPWIFKVKFLNSCTWGVAWPIDKKWEESKLIVCLANNVTLTFDHTHGLDHGFSRSYFEITVSQEWEGWLTLNKMDVSRSFITLMWPFGDQVKGVRFYQIVAGWLKMFVCHRLT